MQRGKTDEGVPSASIEFYSALPFSPFRPSALRIPGVPLTGTTAGPR